MQRRRRGVRRARLSHAGRSDRYADRSCDAHRERHEHTHDSTADGDAHSHRSSHRYAQQDADPDGSSYGNAHGYSHRYGDLDANGDADGHTHGNACPHDDSDSHTHPDGHVHPDVHEYTHVHTYGHGHGNAFRNADSHGNSHARPRARGGGCAGAPGEVVTVDVSLVGRGASISIVSGTLTFDPAVLEAVECRAGAAAQAAQKDVSTSEGGPGELIFVVFGLNDNVIADGVLMECDFRIVEGAGAGETQVGGTADGSTPEAESVPMGLVPGTVTVAIPLPELVVGDAAGAPGEVVTVEVSLVGRGASISIVSGTLTFDPAVLEAVECRAGAAAQAAQKDVSTSEGGPGELIFVVFGLNDNVIADGVLMECDFRIVEGAGAGETQVGGTADGSTPEAESVPMGLVPGTVSVS
ncbi:MAG: hypothetical protein KatS3mg076_1658 [Candidatus Binatia bacterium]|nr:MAG: hypothetical protein KatS3mg076_1658 [Candidatus Binatia bacterium]